MQVSLVSLGEIGGRIVYLGRWLYYIQITTNPGGNKIYIGIRNASGTDT